MKKIKRKFVVVILCLKMLIGIKESNLFGEQGAILKLICGRQVLVSFLLEFQFYKDILINRFTH